MNKVANAYEIAKEWCNTKDRAREFALDIMNRDISRALLSYIETTNDEGEDFIRNCAAILAQDDNLTESIVGSCEECKKKDLLIKTKKPYSFEQKKFEDFVEGHNIKSQTAKKILGTKIKEAYKDKNVISWFLDDEDVLLLLADK